MKSFNLYFSHRFKSTLLSTLIIGVLCLILMGSSLSPYVRVYEYETYVTCQMGMCATIAIILCVIVPMLELAGFKNRRNLDTLFFLPVSRTKMALAHYLNGLIQILTIHTAVIFLVFIRLQAYAEYFNLAALVPYYFLSLPTIVIMYSVFSFVFMEANTVADGVVFQVVYIFILALLALFLGDVFDIRYFDNHSGEYLLFYHMAELTDVYEQIVENRAPRLESSYWVSYAVWCVLGLASLVGYVVTFTTRKTEKIGGISDSPFGYKVLIPLTLLCLTQFVGGFGDVFYLTFIGLVIGCIVYRRSFRLKRSDIVVIVVTMLLSAVIDRF